MTPPCLTSTPLFLFCLFLSWRRRFLTKLPRLSNAAIYWLSLWTTAWWNIWRLLYFEVQNPSQYLELHKFWYPVFLSFWVPVKENFAKIYLLLFVLEDKVETDWKIILERSWWICRSMWFLGSLASFIPSYSDGIYQVSVALLFPEATGSGQLCGV